jgi:hypothetical protein
MVARISCYHNGWSTTRRGARTLGPVARVDCRRFSGQPPRQSDTYGTEARQIAQFTAADNARGARDNTVMSTDIGPLSMDICLMSTDIRLLSGPNGGCPRTKGPCPWTNGSCPWTGVPSPWPQARRPSTKARVSRGRPYTTTLKSPVYRLPTSRRSRNPGGRWSTRLLQPLDVELAGSDLNPKPQQISRGQKRACRASAPGGLSTCA